MIAHDRTRLIVRPFFMSMNNIRIEEILADRLLTIDNPSRYLGGEYTVGKKPAEIDAFRVVLSFPDLYEIGMSNHALRLLYDRINKVHPKSVCGRVFSVKADFEELLRERKIPLYDLDYFLPVKSADILAFTVGYELCATNILQILDLSEIAFHADQRGEDEPIVIGGGVSLTNPLPWQNFFDFIFVGEAEEALDEILLLLMALKEEGATRAEKKAALAQFPFLWQAGQKRAQRHIYQHFAQGDLLKHFVIPAFQVPQDNAVVEIMRGCPNGCRFCHAGQFYKPYRQKDYEVIAKQVEQYVKEFGYREITLSSLSSGDHPHIAFLIDHLTLRWNDQKISFSLPSLKVTSFALDILESLSEVRKSGLTFAIESPLSEWQRSINKEVPLEQVIEIILEAKKRGWRVAKFYFMIGLPFQDPQEERREIVNFIEQIYKATQINLNINVGTFIPKAHTPFQWAAQLLPAEAKEVLIGIKQDLRQRVRRAKVSYHEPYVSFLEGIISRGDQQVGALIERAYAKGCRLDAWEEYLKIDVWKSVLEEEEVDFHSLVSRERSLDEELPWDTISLGVSKHFLRSEWLAAQKGQLTERCLPQCDHLCGVCKGSNQVVDVKGNTPQISVKAPESSLDDQEVQPLLIFYRKVGKAVYAPHSAVVRHFEQAFQRGNLAIAFTQGFNPKPRLEFVNPLSMGISGEREVLLAHIRGPFTVESLAALDQALPEGLEPYEYHVIKSKERKVTLSPLLSGSYYQISNVYDNSLQTQLSHANAQPHCEVQSLSEGSYRIKVLGAYNLIKALFGPDVDRFEMLSKISVTREALFASHQELTEVDFSSLKGIWQ